MEYPLFSLPTAVKVRYLNGMERLNMHSNNNVMSLGSDGMDWPSRRTLPINRMFAVPVRSIFHPERL